MAHKTVPEDTTKVQFNPFFYVDDRHVAGAPVFCDVELKKTQ